MHDISKYNLVSTEDKRDAIIVIEEEFWSYSMYITGFIDDFDWMC